MGGVSTDSPSRPADPPDVQEPGEPVETTHVEVTEEAQPVTVEVVEPPIPDRVRRPADLFRLVLALVLLIGGVALGVAAVGTSGAVEQDLADAVSGLPRLLLTLLTWLGAIGVVLLPVRRRHRPDRAAPPDAAGAVARRGRSRRPAGHRSQLGDPRRATGLPPGHADQGQQRWSFSTARHRHRLDRRAAHRRRRHGPQVDRADRDRRPRGDGGGRLPVRFGHRGGHRLLAAAGLGDRTRLPVCVRGDLDPAAGDRGGQGPGGHRHTPHPAGAARRERLG